MRAPTISNYVNATYRLGNLTSSLQQANEVASTQKRINEISDDPLGSSQVLSLNNSIDNLEQIEQNVLMGKSWLEGSETALDSVQDLILDVKTDMQRLVNASVTADERESAVERVNSIIEQIVSLGNTQLNGSYIFGGTDSNVAPFEFDQAGQEVIYKGNNNPFEIRTDRDSNVAVGRDGKETFWDDTVEINSTNNQIVFKEDNGHGSASERILTAVIPDGVYTRETLETAAKNAINEASAKQGYGATYLVDYNENENKYDIREDGSYDGYLKTQFLWETGGDAYIDNISSNSIDPEDITVFFEAENLSISTPEPSGTEPFKLVWQGDDTWEILNNPGYIIIPSTISGTRDTIDIDLNESGTPDISIRLDAPVNRIGDYIEFDITASWGDHGAGHEIGFTQGDLAQAPPVSDNQAQYISELVITDGSNDAIVFEEVDSTGGAATFSIDLNTTGSDIVYTDMGELARDIESLMETASGGGPNAIDYEVSYDSETSRFRIRESGTDLDAFTINWGASTAAETLGFYPVDDATVYPSSDIPLDRNVVLDNSNNTFTFQEVDGLDVEGALLTATVAQGTYRDAASLAGAVETALDSASGVPGADYSVNYDAGTNQFIIAESTGSTSEFRLLFNTGTTNSNYIAKSLGYRPELDYAGGTAYDSTLDPVIMTFDVTNNWIDFSETDENGDIVTASIQIPEGDYISQLQVASVIQQEMRAASYNGVDYSVTYDDSEDEFVFKEGGIAGIKSFSLDWYSGDHPLSNAAGVLGFDGLSDDITRLSISDEPVVSLTIDASNNKLDFLEFNKDNPYEDPSHLAAEVKTKTYTSHDELAHEVEKALEAESASNGNGINYTVSWDLVTQKFTIKENGNQLDKLQLQWNSGDHAPLSQGGTGESISNVLGFDAASDDIHEPMTSSREVEWGIFNTLIDLKQYLSENDTDGIERSIGRLEANYENMTSTIVDVGMKYSRLEIRETITSEVSLTLTERRTSIEDADIVESIMNLQRIETAYQAALASTSRILNLSLVDYLT